MINILFSIHYVKREDWLSADGIKFKLPLPEVVTSSLHDYYGCHQLPFQILFYYDFTKFCYLRRPFKNSMYIPPELCRNTFVIEIYFRVKTKKQNKRTKIQNFLNPILKTHLDWITATQPITLTALGFHVNVPLGGNPSTLFLFLLGKVVDLMVGPDRNIPTGADGALCFPPALHSLPLNNPSHY